MSRARRRGRHRRRDLRPQRDDVGDARVVAAARLRLRQRRRCSTAAGSAGRAPVSDEPAPAARRDLHAAPAAASDGRPGRGRRRARRACSTRSPPTSSAARRTATAARAASPARSTSSPSTCSIPSTGRFRPQDELREQLGAVGALGGERVVAYCGGGISATLDAFALTLLGEPDVAVYDGSMGEWMSDPARPLERG